jgi:hypothetical protein
MSPGRVHNLGLLAFRGRTNYKIRFPKSACLGADRYPADHFTTSGSSRASLIGYKHLISVQPGRFHPSLGPGSATLTFHLLLQL